MFLEMIVCTILKGMLCEEVQTENKGGQLNVLNAMPLAAITVLDTCNFDQKLSGERWGRLDQEIYNWILDELSLRDEGGEGNRYIDLYVRHLKDANRNLDLIFRNSLAELLKMDYKEFVYTSKAASQREAILVGYSSFEIDILEIASHYSLENFRAQVSRFIELNKLDLFIILSNYYYASSNAQEQREVVSKQLLVSARTPRGHQSQDNRSHRDLYSLVLEFVESAIPVSKAKEQRFSGDRSSSPDSESEPVALALSLRLFDVHDPFFSRKKLEPMIKSLISNMC